MINKFTAIITKNKNGNLAARIVELKDCCVQAKNLDKLVLSARREISVYLKEEPVQLTKFVGLYQVEV